MNKNSRHTWPCKSALYTLMMLGIALPGGAVEQYPIGKIAIIVDSRIYSGIQAKLTSYINALVGVEGINSSNIYVNTNYNMGTSYTTIRAQLQQYYSQNGIEGAILIGDIPRVPFECGVIINGALKYEENSVDFYYMDLTDANGQAWTGNNPWVDVLNASSNPFNFYQQGIFDGYNGDKTAEIWVSRIMCRNFTDFRRLANTTLLHPNTDQNAEILIINDYFQRVINRMTAPASVPRRGFLMGDDGDPEGATQAAFNMNYGDLNLPYFTKIGNPDDKAISWRDSLRRTGDHAYEWAVLSEHSGVSNNSFQYNHSNSTTGSFVTNGTCVSPNYSFTDMTVTDGNAPSQTLFYDSHGCSNADIFQNNSLLEMYTMGHNGLIGLGKSSPLGICLRATYYQWLGNGATFGKSFLQWLNSGEPSDDVKYYHLIGAGTLRARAYVPYVTSQINLDAILSNYWNVRPIPTSDGMFMITDMPLFAVVSCAGSAFQPASALYNWKFNGVTFQNNPNYHANLIGVKSLEISENGFLAYKNGADGPFTIMTCVNQPVAVGSCRPGFHTTTGFTDLQIIGRPTGLGRLPADEPAHDYNEDNFIYASLKEEGNNIKRFTSIPFLFDPVYNWGENGNIGQGGIMVREVDANGNTTPGSPYVSLHAAGYSLNGSDYQYSLYCQYRTAQNDHAHKQLVAGPFTITDPFKIYTELFLERNGDQIQVYVHYRDSDGGNETIIQGPSISFNPSNFKWMFFYSGQNSGDLYGTASINFFSSKYILSFAGKLMTFSESGTAKANLTGGNSGTLFTLGSEQTGAQSGLVFSNAASITSAGNLIRAASSYNEKQWLDNSANLTGGLIFRDANGVVILHVAPSGTVRTRGGVLPNMVTQ